MVARPRYAKLARGPEDFISVLHETKSDDQPQREPLRLIMPFSFIATVLFR